MAGMIEEVLDNEGRPYWANVACGIGLGLTMYTFLAMFNLVLPAIPLLYLVIGGAVYIQRALYVFLPLLDNLANNLLSAVACDHE